MPGFELLEPRLVLHSCIINFSGAIFSVVEDQTFATITLTRTGFPSGDVSVDVSIGGVNDTAQVNSDYQLPASQRVVWDNLDASAKTLQIPIINNADDEPDETVRLTLANPQGTSLGITRTATLTIRDDDLTPNTQPAGLIKLTDREIVNTDRDTQSNSYVRDWSRVAADAQGNFQVVWQNAGLDSSGKGIYSRRYNRDGTAVAGQFRVNTRLENDQYKPAIGRNAGSDTIIAFLDAQHAGAGAFETMMAQAYDENLSAVGGNFDAYPGMDDEGSNLLPTPFMLVRPNGELGVTFYWPSYSTDAVDEFRGTWFQPPEAGEFNSTGTRFRLQIPHADYTSEGWDVRADPERAVAVTSEGNVVVVWLRTRSRAIPDVGTRYDSEVYAQRFDANGLALGQPILVEALNEQIESFDTLEDVNVVALNKEHFIVAYDKRVNGTLSFVGRHFSRTGQQIGTPFELLSGVGSSTGGSDDRRLTALPNGDLLLSWYEAVAFGDDRSYIRVFRSDGVPKTTAFLVDDTLYYHGGFDVAPQGGDEFVLVWNEVRGPFDTRGTAVYMQRFSANAAANTAPVLDNSGNPYLVAPAGARLPDEMQHGILIGDLLARGTGGNPITDPDSGAAEGIAVIGANFVDVSSDAWEYTQVSTPQEGDWILIDNDGPLSNASALLLPASARLRYVTTLMPRHNTTATDRSPRGPAQGFLPLETKLDTGLTFRAWDRTTGTVGGRADTSTSGGSTAFSTATETAAVVFETRLFRSFNTAAQLNTYTLEQEFNALVNVFGYQDRSTADFSGFTIFMSPIPGVTMSPLYRMYFGIAFDSPTAGVQTDMGYRYLTTDLNEVTILEGLGPPSQRANRDGCYFREIGVNGGTAILGYIYATSQPGTTQMSQIYRTDLFAKETRTGPPGSPSTGTVLQEHGDHVYTTKSAFEMTKTGTWRQESARGFVRELSPNVGGAAAPARSAPARSIEMEASRPITVWVGDSWTVYQVRTLNHLAAQIAAHAVPTGSPPFGNQEAWSKHATGRPSLLHGFAAASSASASELHRAVSTFDDLISFTDYLFSEWDDLADLLP